MVAKSNRMKAIHSGGKTSKRLFRHHISGRTFATDALKVFGQNRWFPSHHQQQVVTQRNGAWISGLFQSVVQGLGYKKDFNEVINNSRGTFDEFKAECRSVDVRSTIYMQLLESMQGLHRVGSIYDCDDENEEDLLANSSIWRCSTMRKRRTKMNKHKWKKRRKRLRMNTKQTRN